MHLPGNTELLNLFSGFLSESGLSAVSIKNYLSDLRHFIAFSVQEDPLVNIDGIFSNIKKFISLYVENQRATLTPRSTTYRRLASIRKFATFLNLKFSNSGINRYQNITEDITYNDNSSNQAQLHAIDQNASGNSSASSDSDNYTPLKTTILSTAKILEQFRNSLEKEKKTHSTIKNYISDLNHFFTWTANRTPYTTQNLVNILSETHLQTYVTYLKLCHTSTSVINRRQSSIKKLARFCYTEKYIPENPFEIKIATPQIAPLAWIERLINKPAKPLNTPKNRFAILYDKYHSLSWTPYLNIALLVLSTTAMTLFAYNQAIKSARPSSAATALTPPKRQLSFQGRLTDTGGTPIVTAVNVVFKLFDSLSGPTQLYTSGTCSITPDQDGIFNTLIGDGVCGAEIASSVFTDNRDVYLEILVGAETLTPRQQIATVGYALNSESLQGYPASAAATINTVPVIDNSGNLNISAASPSIISDSGIFSLVGQAISVQTAANSGGDIVLQPDSLGSGQILALGGTTDEDSFRISNANLTTGSLLSGYVGNDLPDGRLITLSSGATETNRFWVATDGRTSLDASATDSALIINQTGTGNLISASVSGVSTFTAYNNGDLNITGQYLVNGSPLSGNSNWQRSSGSLSPKIITDSVNIGNAATASALVHLSGLAGDETFFNNGNVGFGLTDPAYTIDVVGDINLTGAIYDNDNAGVSGQYLTTTGTGVEWVDLPLGGYWGRTNGALSPVAISDAINLGNAATASAYVHLAGTANDNSFINTGSFGVGTISPDRKLEVIDTNPQLRLTYTDGSVYSDIYTNSSGQLVLDPSNANNIIQIGNGGLLQASATTTELYHTNGTVQFQNTTMTGTSGTINPVTVSPTFSPATGTMDLNSLYVNPTVNQSGTATGNYTALKVNVTETNALGSSNYLAQFGKNNSYSINITSAGYVGINVLSPAYELEVGGDINLTGGLYVSDNPGVSGQILSSTGTGLQWIDPSTAGENYWQRNSGALSPVQIWESINLGNTATASALVHLSSVAGDETFFNNGNVGIGLINPAYTLDITGDINLTGAFYDNGSAGTPGQILSTTGTGVAWIDAPVSASDNLWQENSGVVSPINITDSLAIGGTATSSALFYVDGATNGSASTAGTFAFRGTTNPKINILNGEDLGIQTSVGGDSGLSEKVTILNNGNFGIGDTSPASLFTVGNGDMFQVDSSGVTTIGGSTAATTGTVRLTNNAILSWRNAGNSDNITALSVDASDNLNLGYSGSGIGSTNIKFFNAQTEVMRLTGGTLGLGTQTPLATLDVRGNSGTTPVASVSGNTTASALIVDQSGSGDIFSASSSGLTRFTISNTGSVYISSLGTGVVKSTSGILSSGYVDLTTDISGILPIANGGTNNNTFTSGKFVAFDGSKLASTAFDGSSFESPLTFSNGLTRTVNAITLGGTLTGNTEIALAGYNLTLTGTGNVGIGTAVPLQKFDVGGGVFVVDTANNRVGINTATPSAALEIAGVSSTISNSTGSGNITLNSDSGIFDFSGDSLNNLLHATISGQLRLGNYTTGGLPTSIGAGALVYNTTSAIPQYWNGSSWADISVSYFTRDPDGFLYPTFSQDSILLGGDPTASTSALIRLSTTDTLENFFMNPVAIGFQGPIDHVGGPGSTMLQVAGSILPDTTASYYLGDSTLAWIGVYLSGGIFDDTGTQLLSTSLRRFSGGSAWNIVDGLRVGDTSNTLNGNALYVAGSATVSGSFGVVGNSSLIGNVTVGGGTGKIDVGTVDPPYTINGEKYGTFLVGMIGIKEEVMGKVTTSEHIPGLGYRTLIDLDGQAKGSDLWLFGKTTNLKDNISKLSVLLTARGQAKTWYEIDDTNKILAIYSSNPTEVIYRLTAPRFDEANWTNTRTSESVGFIINEPDINNNISGTGLLNASISAPELILGTDNRYQLTLNGETTQEIGSFAEGLFGYLKAGTQEVIDLFANNLTIGNKLISPMADIDQLKTIDATISGTLFADNIKSKTIDGLNLQLDLLNERYSTASAILSDLQAKYSSYGSLFGSVSTASASGDPLALSPLATTSATIPSDLALNSLNVHTLIGNDILANGSILAQSFGSIDSDLFIQPTGDRPVHLLANLMSLYPDGKVLINGDLLITGTLYAAGLDAQTATVSGTLAIGRGDIATDSGKLMAIFNDNGQIISSVDASGSASFGQVVTGGLIIASGAEDQPATISGTINSNTTIGTATIATGTAEIAIINNKVTDRTLIYLTPISNTLNQVLYVKSKQSGVGFTVAVPAKPNQVSQEILFNYWLVETL